MGNCCTGQLEAYKDIEATLQNNRISRFKIEDEYLNQSMMSDKESENNFSEAISQEDKEKHIPGHDKASPIGTIPMELKEIIDGRAAEYQKFQFDDDPEIVDRAFLLGPRQLKSHSIYIGQWYNKKRNGRGQQIMQDSSIYIGYWKDGKKHGKGMLIDVSGDVYNGYWKNNQCNGFGTLKKDNGAVFKGMWKNDNRNGLGSEIWPNGEAYRGNYQNGKKHGMGLYTINEDSYYEGSFKLNSIDGFGKFVYEDGSVYKGNWSNNQKNGNGKYTWVSGAVFSGNYINNEKEGEGIYYNKSEQITLNGTWKNDELTGKFKAKLNEVEYTCTVSKGEIEILYPISPNKLKRIEVLDRIAEIVELIEQEN